MTALDNMTKEELVVIAKALLSQPKSTTTPVVVSADINTQAVRRGRKPGPNYATNQQAKQLAESLIAIRDGRNPDEAKATIVALAGVTNLRIGKRRAERLIASFGGGETHGQGLRQSIITISKRLREGQTVAQVIGVG